MLQRQRHPRPRHDPVSRRRPDAPRALDERGHPAGTPERPAPSTFAIETRLHQIAARRFKADTKDLHHLVNLPCVGTPMDMLRNNLRRYQQLLQRLPPSDRSLKARRRTWQSKFARETKLLDALMTAMADGVDRMAKRARTRLLRELSREARHGAARLG